MLKVSDRSGKLASPEELKTNLTNYINRMKGYQFVQLGDSDPVEYDPTNYRHKQMVDQGARIQKGVHFDKEYKIISQYGGGNMIKPGSYDRYTPFKNFPEANFICIVWPMGLVQVSCNPFKPKKIEDINLGEISKEVLAKHEPILKKFYVTLEDVKRESEASQDWKKMQKEEGDEYQGIGFKFSDLDAFYKDCIKVKVADRKVEIVDIYNDELRETMDVLYEDLTDAQKAILKKYKIAVWELITRNSGGHKAITNISGIQYLKYNKPAMLIAYKTEKYVEVMKGLAKDFINTLKEKIDLAEAGEAVKYDTAGEVELSGQISNESRINEFNFTPFNYHQDFLKKKLKDGDEVKCIKNGHFDNTSEEERGVVNPQFMTYNFKVGNRYTVTDVNDKSVDVVGEDGKSKIFTRVKSNDYSGHGYFPYFLDYFKKI